GFIEEKSPGIHNVAHELTGLKPNTQYWVRLAAMDLFDPPVQSSEQTFTTTLLPALKATIKPIAAVTATPAHFSGTIDPEAPAGDPAASNVSWHFECTPECPGLEGAIPADAATHEVSVEATGLKPNTSYKVSLVASNANGPISVGPEQFTTGIAAPTSETI